MTPQISKEAMEKAKELTDKFFNHESSPKYFEDGDIPKWIGYLMESIALEFTNYQKRIDELEKLLVRILKEDGIDELAQTITEAKSAVACHLTKGVKEEG
jgi:hypothetical protein